MQHVEIHRTELGEIQKLRDIYCHEMHCQVIHDSIHSRPGWTEEYAIWANGAMAGYGSIAVAGPWKNKPTLYEFFVLPPLRARLFSFFDEFRKVAGIRFVETQSNDFLLAALLLSSAESVSSESVLFHDKITTSLALAGAAIRKVEQADAGALLSLSLDAEADWMVTFEGAAVGVGGILYHYNRPYGDIYMQIAEPFRQRGLGSLLVQELKRICYEGGSIPAARCNPNNKASRAALQKAGFVPCGHIINGVLGAL